MREVLKCVQYVQRTLLSFQENKTKQKRQKMILTLLIF